MTTILRIDSSSRSEVKSDFTQSLSVEGSFSRALASQVTAHLLASHPDALLVERDLMKEVMPHITNDTITGYYTPENERTASLREATALSDQLIEEIKKANFLVLSAPIYNFGIPSALKAWFDQVVRLGETFAYEDGNFNGLIEGKKAFVCCSYGAGGYLNNGPLAGYDYMAPYLSMILNFIGIKDVVLFPVEATTADAETVVAQMTIATENINQHFEV